MHERNPAAARALFWSAALLLALSAYGLATRLDAMVGPLRMFVNMAVGEHIPLGRALRYVEWDILLPPLYQLLCGVVALTALFVRRSRRGCAALLALCAGLIALGFLSQTSLLGRIERTASLILLTVMGLLCLLTLLYPLLRRRAAKARSQPSAPDNVVPMQQPIERRRPSRRRRIS